VVRQLTAIVADFTITRARSHLERDLNQPFKNPHVIDAFCEGLSRLDVPAWSLPLCRRVAIFRLVRRLALSSEPAWQWLVQAETQHL
jgi:hypothetical protein